MNVGTHISGRPAQPVSSQARCAYVRSYSLRKGLDMSKNIVVCLGLAALVLVWDIDHPGYAVPTVPTTETSTGEDRPFDHVVTGILDQLDFSTGKGLLKTDLGKPVFFEMVRPELFRRLSVGQRVTIGMNEQGQAVTVMEIPPPEIPTPPPAVQ